MLFVVSAVLFDMLKARQLACVSKSGQKCPAALSLSSWRAWIEISWSHWEGWWRAGRSPHGERGLKSLDADRVSRIGQSLSSWRAWIEIVVVGTYHKVAQSLSSWRAWIEIHYLMPSSPMLLSLSSWRAWIEIRIHVLGCLSMIRSLSSWRAWIEISTCAVGTGSKVSCRSPHGERGLK